MDIENAPIVLPPQGVPSASSLSSPSDLPPEPTGPASTLTSSSSLTTPANTSQDFATNPSIPAISNLGQNLLTDQDSPLGQDLPSPATILPADGQAAPGQDLPQSADLPPGTDGAPTQDLPPAPPLKRPWNARFPILSFPCDISYADLLDQLPSSNASTPCTPLPYKKIKSASLIKSALNRLEQYGALASPTDVGRHSKAKDDSDGPNEDYYDLDDGFIDDSEIMIEDVSEAEWTKALKEGFYCLPSKDYKPDADRKRRRYTAKRDRKPPMDTTVFSTDAQRIIAAIRKMYPKDKKGKIQKNLHRSIIALLKADDPKPTEAELKSLLRTITQLPVDTIVELHTDACRKLQAETVRSKYFHSLQVLGNSISRVCKDTVPTVLPEEIGKQYGECQRLLTETITAAKGLKGMKGFEEGELRGRIAERVKNASYLKLGEQDLAAVAGK